MPINEYSSQKKICPVCKKPFTNRKRWAQRGIWEQIVYCSERCRVRRNSKSI